MVYFRAVALVVCMSCCVPAALAENVLIRARGGSVGQGWLFGGPGGECWVVSPAHVVASPETGALEPFHYTDTQGRTGESARPFAGGEDNRDSSAAVESRDLAFARVVAGREDGACMSRLGPPTLKYQSIMRKMQGFTVVSALPTSYGSFPAEFSRGSIDAYGGAVIDFSVTPDVAEAFLRKGISGALVMTADNGASLPMAMVLRVRQDTNSLRAMRFDYIKDRFSALVAKTAASRDERASDSGVPYRVAYFKGVPDPRDTGVMSLRSGDGCWRVRPLDGERVLELVLFIPVGTRAERAVLVRNGDCGEGKMRYGVDQRVQDADLWETVTSCAQEAGDETGCRIGVSGPRQLRFRFDALEPAAIRQLRLE